MTAVVQEQPKLLGLLSQDADGSVQEGMSVAVGTLEEAHDIESLVFVPLEDLGKQGAEGNAELVIPLRGDSDMETLNLPVRFEVLEDPSLDLAQEL